MAISIKEEKEDKLEVLFTGEWLDKLRKVTKDYGTKGDAYTLAFIIGTMAESDGKGIKIGTKTYTPYPEIIE